MKWDNYPMYLSIPDGNDLILVPFQEILLLRAEGNYTSVLTLNKRYLVSKLLTSFEEVLPEGFFARVHKSFIVNLAYARKISRGKNMIVELIDGSEIPISFTKKEIFFKKLENIVMML